MTTANDQAGCGDHAIYPLPTRQPGILLDAVDGHFRGTAEHREHGTVLEEVDCVVAPLALRHLAPVQAENTIELAPIEGYAGGGGRHQARPLAAQGLARISFAGTQRHGAP